MFALEPIVQPCPLGRKPLKRPYGTGVGDNREQPIRRQLRAAVEHNAVRATSGADVRGNALLATANQLTLQIDRRQRR